MTKHPITPPLELVRQWSDSSPIQYSEELWAYELFIAHQAARWGSDQELEACCEWLSFYSATSDARDLRAARRPKPPSLKEQALAELETLSDYAHGLGCSESAIRRALEQLNG